MKIKEITVHTSIKNSLPNYGSVEYGSGITIQLEENDNEKKAYHIAWLHVMSQVLYQMAQRINSPELNKKSAEIQLELLETQKDGELQT
jgi:hypothetical protein